MRTLVLLAALACGTDPSPADAPAPAPAAGATPAPAAPQGPPPEAVARAQSAMKALGGDLKARLIEQMGAGGPKAAVEVCGAEAQDRTAAIAARTGVTVGRSSVKLRNPANAGPDWVRAWLAANDGPAADAEPAVSTASVDGADVVRVVAPIPVEAPCLVCHGPADRIPADVSAYLAEAYPDDAATGYAVGDLRGAIWAQAPVP